MPARGPNIVRDVVDSLIDIRVTLDSLVWRVICTIDDSAVFVRFRFFHQRSGEQQDADDSCLRIDSSAFLNKRCSACENLSVVDIR